MATKVRKAAKPAAKSTRATDDAEKKLDAMERMAWIEQGGIDLREERGKPRASPRQRRKS